MSSTVWKATMRAVAGFSKLTMIAECTRRMFQPSDEILGGGVGSVEALAEVEIEAVGSLGRRV
jgi:hypothetical protein